MELRTQSPEAIRAERAYRRRRAGLVVLPIEVDLVALAVAHGIVGAAAEQGRRHRPGQQDRADGLGDDGQRRALQGTRRACGVKEIAPDIWRDVKVGRANST